jgi:hypothetical protein
MSDVEDQGLPEANRLLVERFGIEQVEDLV